MKFRTRGELYLWLKYHKICQLDSGSQGVCYKIGGKVYKIFIQFIDDDEEDMIVYDKDEILRFCSVVNNTYIFPNDVIIVGDVVVGYITDYVNAISLYKLNPLEVDIEKLQIDLAATTKDIEIISNHGILSYDVTYNILYGNGGFNVIDTIEYSLSDMDSLELFKKNKERFYHEIRLFLLDGYFDKFMKNNPSLYNMCYESEFDFCLFFKEFLNKLSENEGHRISKLGDAKKSLVRTKNRSCKYIRDFD